MTLFDKKMAVLNQLKQEINPISLPLLLSKLGPDINERTLRRWLFEFIDKGLVKKQGLKKATKYFIASDQVVQENESSVCFAKENLKIIQIVRRPIYERKPVIYNDDWFDHYVPNKTFYISQSDRVELELLGKRSKKEDPAGTYAHQVFNRLLIDLSYNSSRLEGNTYSLLDTKRLLLEGASAEGKLDEEKIMILNHKEAIRYLVDNAFRLEINEQTIFTLHFLLSDGLLESRYSGKIRDHGVRIGGSTYIPYEEKIQLEMRFKRVLEKAKLIEDFFEQSLFLLAHISYLQTFSDVNKRTARLSANIPLIKSNYVPLSFNDVKRDDYASAMIAIYELQEVNPLVDLYKYSYIRACALYDSTVKSLGYDEIRVRYRTQRRQLLRDIILNKLIGDALQNYIESESLKISKEDRKGFVANVLDDLKEIDENRIIGLGVSSADLDSWRKA